MPRLRAKGQVIIPQDIRERLKLMRAVEGDYERALHRVESVRGTATVKRWTTDELLAMTRGRD
jgi:bifunctional DNA-binding transcriptional regulator/antitoxin component of YhaV-PrlF toxin-antitoxin module